MAKLDDGMFKAAACLKNFGAVFVENGPTTCAAVHIALVCDSEVICVDPLDAVRFTQATFLAFGEQQRAALVDCVNLGQIYGASREVV